MLCSKFSFATTTALETSRRGRLRDRLLFSALPPSSPGDARKRNGTVRGSVYDIYFVFIAPLSKSNRVTEKYAAPHEPSTWAMMLMGFLGLRYSGHKARRGNVLQAALRAKHQGASRL